MEFDVQPMQGTGVEYSSRELSHQPISQLVLNVFEASAMGQIDVFVSVEIVIVKFFSIELSPICKEKRARKCDQHRNLNGTHFA